jgi:Bacterial regulatory protein, Fis family
MIEQALQNARFNTSKAARALGLTPSLRHVVRFCATRVGARRDILPSLPTALQSPPTSATFVRCTRWRGPCLCKGWRHSTGDATLY